jgi:hypothetical protein
MDPVELSLLAAPPDDEPESEQERADLERALRDARRDTSRRSFARVRSVNGFHFAESGEDDVKQLKGSVLEDGTIRIAQVKHRREAYR